MSHYSKCESKLEKKIFSSESQSSKKHSCITCTKYFHSAGFLPLLSHASMTVKPLLLKLYETHVLPISASLKSAAAGIILGVLPGLEEGTEFFEW